MTYCLNYRQLFATMVIAIFITVASSFAHAQLRKPVILFIDGIHSVDSDMWNVLKTSMDGAGENGIRLIGATTEKEYQMAFGSDEAILRRFAPIGVSEFTEVRTIEIIKLSWRDVVEKRYDVKIDDEIVEQVVKHYKKVLPDVARPDGQKSLEGRTIL